MFKFLSKHLTAILLTILLFLSRKYFMLKKFLCIFAVLCALLPSYKALSENIDNLFEIPFENTQTTHMPFKVSESFQNNTLTYEFILEGGSYLYKDAFKVSGDGFNYTLKFNKSPQIHATANESHEVFYNNVKVYLKILNAKKDAKLTLNYQGCSQDGICYPVQSLYKTLPYIKGSFESFSIKDLSKTDPSSLFLGIDDSLILTLLLSFILGITLDLTPCVLPMLAVFSAMITGSKSKNFTASLLLNLSYLLGIALTYTAVGFVFAKFGASAQSYLQHPAVIIFISLLFIILSLDCMGIISLKMPDKYNRYLQEKISRNPSGKLWSSFLFGVLSAFLATPCTSAPLAGALLYVATSGNLIKGTLLFLFIGLGMGFPLVIIGLFGNRGIFKLGRFAKVIRNLLALPLIIGAYYLSRHLLGSYQDFVAGLLTSFCFGYTAYLLLENLGDLKKKQVLTLSFASFAAGFILYVNSAVHQDENTLPNGFIQVKNSDDLMVCQKERCLITFSAKWCSNCHKLDNDIYANAEFKKLALGYKKFRVDLTTQDDPKIKQLINTYELIGVPTLIITNDKGDIVNKRIGLFNLEDLKKDL